MALEPITRQEQIIAGKDLEPITRMEMFLKQYGGGSGGGSSSGGKEPFFTGTLDKDMSVENLISGFNYEATQTQVYYPLVKLSDDEVAKLINIYENGLDAVFDTTVMVDGNLLQLDDYGTEGQDNTLFFIYKGDATISVDTDNFSSPPSEPSVYASSTELKIYLTGENKGKSVACFVTVQLALQSYGQG